MSTIPTGIKWPRLSHRTTKQIAKVIARRYVLFRIVGEQLPDTLLVGERYADLLALILTSDTCES
jgi:hypothetical protein